MARQGMQRHFPLSERLWLDWLDDELKAASKPKAQAAIQELFELAVQDYLSVPIWTKYLGCVLLVFTDGDFSRCIIAGSSTTACVYQAAAQALMLPHTAGVCAVITTKCAP